MTEQFKIGDRVRLKIDPKFGILKYINGPGEFVDIQYPLGVKDYGCHISEITKTPHKNFICKCNTIYKEEYKYGR